MDLDLTWLLWGLPLAFAAGWFASRFDLRQLRIQSQQAPKAYFRGLNHLLNEQQDQAIDAFIEAVQGDPDTAELHFALGNLFPPPRRLRPRCAGARTPAGARRRQSKDRERAQHALALDFLKAGLLDRAEAALHKLDGTSFEGRSPVGLLAIYERSRDWPQARRIAARLDAAQPGSFATRLAHYLCEEAEQQQRSGHTEQALALLEQAVQQAPQMPRGWLALSALKAQAGQALAALDALVTLATQAPQGLPLAARAMADLARQTAVRLRCWPCCRLATTGRPRWT